MGPPNSLVLEVYSHLLGIVRYLGNFLIIRLKLIRNSRTIRFVQIFNGGTSIAGITIRIVTLAVNLLNLGWVQLTLTRTQLYLNGSGSGFQTQDSDLISKTGIHIVN